MKSVHDLKWWVAGRKREPEGGRGVISDDAVEVERVKVLLRRVRAKYYKYRCIDTTQTAEKHWIR